MNLSLSAMASEMHRCDGGSTERGHSESGSHAPSLFICLPSMKPRQRRKLLEPRRNCALLSTFVLCTEPCR